MNNQKHKQEKTQETCMYVCIYKKKKTGNHNVHAKGKSKNFANA